MPGEIKFDLSVFAKMQQVANVIAEGQGIVFDSESIKDLSEKLLEIKQAAEGVSVSFKPKKTKRSDIIKLLKEDADDTNSDGKA